MSADADADASSGSRLLQTLERAGLQAPETVRRVDAAAALGALRRPNFTETSPHVGEVLSPWRLTYYFDAEAEPDALTDTIRQRLAAMAEVLQIPVPEALDRWIAIADAARDPAARQLVLGVDVRDDPNQTRLKHYVILEGDATDIVVRLCRATGVTPPEAAELAKTHIAAVDLTRAGLHDVKLYYSLEPDAAARALRDPRPTAALLQGCRRVIYQHSLIRSEKRSMHFHADSPTALWRTLEELRSSAPATDALLRHVRAINKAPGPRLEPWILSHPWLDGRLDRGRYSLYLHLTDATP